MLTHNSLLIVSELKARVEWTLKMFKKSTSVLTLAGYSAPPSPPPPLPSKQSQKGHGCHSSQPGDHDCSVASIYSDLTQGYGGRSWRRAPRRGRRGHWWWWRGGCDRMARRVHPIHPREQPPVRCSVAQGCCAGSAGYGHHWQCC